jgi:hypothetical protein
MAQPTNVPRWNTTGANRTDPPAGTKDAGLVAGAPLVSSYLNWLLFTIYEWTLYVKNIGAEILTWTAAHTFNAGIIVVKPTGTAIDATANGASGAIAVKGTANHAAGLGAYFTNALGTALSAVGVIGGIFEGTLFGLLGTASSPGSFAVSGQHSGAGAGGLFTSTGAEGVRAEGGAGGLVGTFAALITNLAGAGGVRAKGGAVSGAVGGRFEGATSADGAATPGIGATFQGGSPSIGTGVAGLRSTGGNNAAGAEFQGGGTIGVGLQATGASSGGAGVVAINGLANNLPAVDCRGTIDFLNASAPAIGTAIANKLTRNSFAKAWVLLQCNGTAAPTVIDGLNVASVTQVIAGVTNGEITINLANGMASANYAVVPVFQNVFGGDRPLCFPKTFTSASSVVLEGQTTSGIVMTAAAWSARRLYVEIMGS